MGKSELLRVQKALSLFPDEESRLCLFFWILCVRKRHPPPVGRETEIFTFFACDSCFFLHALAPHNSLLSFPFFSSLTKACNNVRARRRKKKKKKKTRRRKRRGRKRRGKRDERGDRVRENLGVLLCVYIFIHTFFLLSLRCYCFRENVKLTKSFL